MIEMSALTVERTVFLADLAVAITMLFAKSNCEHLRIFDAHLHDMFVRETLGGPDGTLVASK
jgi:hypothetical protein